MAARVGSGHVLLCVTDHESAAATSELVNHLAGIWGEAIREGSFAGPSLR